MYGDDSPVLRRARKARKSVADQIRERNEKVEAKQRAQILRQCEIIEKLLDLLPPKQARTPVNRLIREVLRTIRSADNGEAK